MYILGSNSYFSCPLGPLCVTIYCSKMFPSIGPSVYQQRISFSSPLRTGHTRSSADFLKPHNYQIPNPDHNIPFRSYPLHPFHVLICSTCGASWSHSHTSRLVGLLDEWSVCRTDLYLTTHSTHNRHPWPWRDSNPLSQEASGRKPLRFSPRDPLRPAAGDLSYSWFLTVSVHRSTKFQLLDTSLKYRSLSVAKCIPTKVCTPRVLYLWSVSYSRISCLPLIAAAFWKQYATCCRIFYGLFNGAFSMT
jgi:hypothetical protein